MPAMASEAEHLLETEGLDSPRDSGPFQNTCKHAGRRTGNCWNAQAGEVLGTDALEALPLCPIRTVVVRTGISVV